MEEQSRAATSWHAVSARWYGYTFRNREGENVGTMALQMNGEPWVLFSFSHNTDKRMIDVSDYHFHRETAACRSEREAIAFIEESLAYAKHVCQTEATFSRDVSLPAAALLFHRACPCPIA